MFILKLSTAGLEYYSEDNYSILQIVTLIVKCFGIFL
jgi:hypothetical protein